MDNPEYTFQILEVFSKIKTKEIPRELEEYISYVARTGDPVFQWSLVKILIKEKLLAVLNEFKETNPSLEIPPCPNVDPFSYEAMKSNLLSRLDSFILPPFTIQRICELLSAPRKEYNRIDKYMRAVEKNVLVVSACELSLKRGLEADGSESMMNGMLYDKVNDSLNNFTNHVFSTTHESNVDELHLSSKIDATESDTVQQILDEPWTETGDSEEFKINETNNASLSVSFDNELHFVTEKNSNNDKIDTADETESKNIGDDSSFNESSSLLIEPSLQSMIVDNDNIRYDHDVSKPSTSSESTINEPTSECNKRKENVALNFNDDTSQNVINSSTQNTSLITPENETSSHSEKESFDTSTNVESDSESTENDIENNLVSCSNEDSFCERIMSDKNLELEKEIDTEEPYKTERSFEYEDFSEISSKSEESDACNFTSDISKTQTDNLVLEYADKLSDADDSKNDNDEIEKAVFSPTSSADPVHDNQTVFQTNETSDHAADESNFPQDNSDAKEANDESLSCGDKESSRSCDTADCSKELDPVPKVHGEPERNNVAGE